MASNISTIAESAPSGTTVELGKSDVKVESLEPKYSRFNGASILAYAVLIFGALMALLPFLYTVSVSLMNLTEATGGQLIPSELHWENYIEAWNDAKFSLYFWNSVRITILTVAGQIVFCTFAAYAFARMEFPGKEFLFA
ncbi:hypothetical protein KFU94_54895 [Chloroflexi bacterium TSY]|nr:hypothetical protein [Chloroflexi bacterium TSY]